MEELFEERNINVVGSLHYANEAVFLDGEPGEWAILHHESKLAQNLQEVIERAGGRVVGDTALFI